MTARTGLTHIRCDSAMKRNVFGFQTFDSK